MNDILREGIRLDLPEPKGRFNLDFNTQGKQAHYISESLIQTQYFEKVRIPQVHSGSAGGIVKYHVPMAELKNLKIKVFESANEEWADFVVKARNGNVVHDYDIVIGPKLRNLKAIKGLEPATAYKNEIQIALTSEKSAAIFSKYRSKQP